MMVPIFGHFCFQSHSKDVGGPAKSFSCTVLTLKSPVLTGRCKQRAKCVVSWTHIEFIF